MDSSSSNHLSQDLVRRLEIHLRRILLSSLEGYAISAIRIAGVDHEFSSIPGVVEDVVDIILNIKQIRLKSAIKGDKATEHQIYITISGQDEFRAKDIESKTNVFKVMNPELLICKMEPSVNLELEMTITKGRGYVPAEENMPENAPIGVIPVDAIYTPIEESFLPRIQYPCWSAYGL